MTMDVADNVDRLLGELEKVEPPFETLGTPVLGETDAVKRLVLMGGKIVPNLLERTKETSSPKRLAYIALILGRIGDQRAVEPLRVLRARFQGQASKSMWDYAVIGQCDVALSKLSKSVG